MSKRIADVRFKDGRIVGFIERREVCVLAVDRPISQGVELTIDHFERPEQAAPAEVMELRQAARHLGVPFKWLKSEAEAGRLPCLNADGKLLFHMKIVRAEIASQAAVGRMEPQPERV